MSQMLEMMAQGQSDPRAMIDALVASGKVSPERRQLLEMMMQPPAKTDADEGDEGDADLADADKDRQLEQAQSLMLESADRIAWLEDLTDRLGLALGACPECFGTLSDCEECHGRGAPGSRRASRKEFTRFVLPVLNRMRSGRARAPAPAVADPVAGQQIDHPRRRD